jgi:hypothetical protein
MIKNYIFSVVILCSKMPKTARTNIIYNDGCGSLQITRSEYQDSEYEDYEWTPVTGISVTTSS